MYEIIIQFIYCTSFPPYVFMSGVLIARTSLLFLFYRFVFPSAMLLASKDSKDFNVQRCTWNMTTICTVLLISFLIKLRLLSPRKNSFNGKFLSEKCKKYCFCCWCFFYLHSCRYEWETVWQYGRNEKILLHKSDSIYKTCSFLVDEKENQVIFLNFSCKKFNVLEVCLHELRLYTLYTQWSIQAHNWNILQITMDFIRL